MLWPVCDKKCLERQSHKDENGFILGTCRGYGIFKIVCAIELFSGVKIPYEIIRRRSGNLATINAVLIRVRNGLTGVRSTALMRGAAIPGIGRSRIPGATTSDCLRLPKLASAALHKKMDELLPRQWG